MATTLGLGMGRAVYWDPNMRIKPSEYVFPRSSLATPSPPAQGQITGSRLPSAAVLHP
ncbi:MAG: hypothetical protein HC924_12895 [Synechococcaceae cyanobacterium SM2_3_2]|nr:hypothetical protein [Synechococcaceae cyanobacterium SM2_3_2]